MVNEKTQQRVHDAPDSLEAAKRAIDDIAVVVG
jgi:hypothetical protein